MDRACESEVRILNENALRFSIVSRPTPVLEYIKALSSVIGASHIIAVFEETDSLKVYFDDKQYVDIILESGIHVMNRHVRIDYVIPPGLKVILSNVDPILSNSEIIQLISRYGTIVSPIIRPSICDDVELCHIRYGVRYVYMNVNGTLPYKVEFECGEQLCNIRMRVEEKPELFTISNIKTDTNENTPETEVLLLRNLGVFPGTNSDECENSHPIINSVESAVLVNDPQLQASVNDPQLQVSLNDPQLQASVNDPQLQVSLNDIQLKINSSVSLQEKQTPISKRGRRLPKNLVMTNVKIHRKHKDATPTSQAAWRIKRSCKKLIGGEKKYGRHKHKLSSIRRKKSTSQSPSVSKFSISSACLKSLNTRQINKENPANLHSSFKSVLNPQKLLMFLDEVKHHRAPKELVKKYLGENYDSELFGKFIRQLNQYSKTHNDANLKHRVWRLIKTITDDA